MLACPRQVSGWFLLGCLFLAAGCAPSKLPVFYAEHPDRGYVTFYAGNFRQEAGIWDRVDGIHVRKWAPARIPADCTAEEELGEWSAYLGGCVRYYGRNRRGFNSFSLPQLPGVHVFHVWLGETSRQGHLTVQVTVMKETNTPVRVEVRKISEQFLSGGTYVGYYVSIKQIFFTMATTVEPSVPLTPCPPGTPRGADAKCGRIRN